MIAFFGNYLTFKRLLLASPLATLTQCWPLASEMLTFLHLATSAYILPSYLHVCTPAHPHRWRTAPLRMEDSKWSASDEVSMPTRSTRSKALPLRMPPATLLTPVVHSDAGIAA